MKSTISAYKAIAQIDDVMSLRKRNQTQVDWAWCNCAAVFHKPCAGADPSDLSACSLPHA